MPLYHAGGWSLVCISCISGICVSTTGFVGRLFLDYAGSKR